LKETSADKNSNDDNSIKNNNDQTNQVGDQTSHDIKADEVFGKKFTASGPETFNKENPVLVEPMAKLASNYFCFECGSVLTTTEDKKQHELIEIERKNRNDLEK
jgi:hypothetical protein